MDQPPCKSRRRWLRFSLRGLLIVTSVLAILLAWRMHHVRTSQRVAELLTEANVSFTPGRNEQPWHGIPALEPVRFTSLSIKRGVGANPSFLEAAEHLETLNTIEKVYLYGWTEDGSPEDFAVLAKLGSITSIDIDGGVDGDAFRPLIALTKLESFSCSGSSGYCSDDALALLLGMPSVKNVGLPQAEHDVPPELRRTRPDIDYFITDFPP
ncbi:hypothetical protein [Aeoliella sp.]|uniref:hypothetical protein n=1 Tax=Aeoliella sp. TaxID=2795800 RepID=UPI003CCBF4DF